MKAAWHVSVHTLAEDVQVAEGTLVLNILCDWVMPLLLVLYLHEHVQRPGREGARAERTAGDHARVQKQRHT